MVLLVRAAPAIVSHDEVLQSLWPDRVVTQQSVARLVADTRKALKHAGLSGPAIETCHGRGYRLAAPLARKITLQEPATDAPNILRPWPWLFALLAVFAIAGAGWWLWPQPKPLAYSEAHNTELRILWVDDHPENNQVEADYLRSLGYGVHQVRESADAETLMAIYQFDLLLSDMGRNNNPVAGLELLDALRAEGNAIPVLFYTLVVNPPLLNEVQSRGGQGAADTQDALYRQIDALTAAP